MILEVSAEGISLKSEGDIDAFNLGQIAGRRPKQRITMPMHGKQSWVRSDIKLSDLIRLLVEGDKLT